MLHRAAIGLLSRPSIALLAFILLSHIAPACLHGATPPPETAPASTAPASAMDPHVNDLITRLAATDHATRDAADKELRQMAWHAMPELIVARSAATDPEAMLRLTAIMQDLCWNTDGLSPDTAKLIAVHRSANTSLALLGSSIEGDPAAMAIFHRANLILKQQWYNDPSGLQPSPPRAQLDYIATLKRRGAWDQLEWELIASGSWPDLTVVIRQRPADAARLAPAVAALQRMLPTETCAAPVVRVTLAYASGNTEQALRFARLLDQRHYLEQLLAERQDWPALARFRVEHDFFNVSRFVPAAALLFSGKPAEADAIIDAHSKAANGIEPVGLQRQVVLLGRIELINKACLQRGDTDALVQFLLLERRYHEAFEHRPKPAATRTGKDAWPGGTISVGGTIALGPPAAMDAQINSRLDKALAKLTPPEKPAPETAPVPLVGDPAWLDPNPPIMRKWVASLPPQKPSRDDLLRDAKQGRADPAGDPSFQFIAGVFEARAGDIAAGKKLQQEADFVLGGDVKDRLYLAQTLRSLGETDLARAQAEFITQIDRPVSTTRFAAHRLLAEIAQEQGRFADALQHCRLAFFAQFYDFISIPEPYEDYFRLPRTTAYCESRAAIAKDDRPTALRAAGDVITLDPEGLDLTITLIRAFTDHHWPDQAKSLADQNRTVLENTLKDFPNSPLHHYLIARLDLDTGFTTPQTTDHLQKALELAPNNPDYLKLQAAHPR